MTGEPVEALQKEANKIMKTEAYQVKTHPGHEGAVSRVKAIYKRLYPQDRQED
jgi:hypothetical protein